MIQTRFFALLRRFGKDRSGATAIIFAIVLPIIILALGLGAETGYWYLMQRQLQNAADTAAYAGAVRNRAGDAYEQIEAAAIYVAQANGLPPDAPKPVVTSPFDNSAGKVEVILERQVTRLISPVGPDRLTARAVAEVGAPGPDACVLALSPDARGAVTIGGSATVNLNGCDLVSNSSAANAIDIYGSAQVDEACAYAVGGVQGDHLLTEAEDCSANRQLTSPLPDPYAHLSPPSQSLCGTVWEGMTVRCLTSFSLDQVQDNSLYIITSGQVSAGNSRVTAKNVAFFLSETARLSLQGNAQINLSAPTSGSYSGILFHGTQSGSVTNTIRGTVDSSFTGASYFPSSNVEYSGNSATGCTRIVAQTITFTGHSGVSCTSEGGQTSPLERPVTLVE